MAVLDDHERERLLVSLGKLRRALGDSTGTETGG